MTAGALWRLVAQSLRRDRRGAALSAFGVAVGVSALVFFVALGQGVGRVIRERIFPLDARMLDVVPPPLALGGLLGSGKLDEPTVARLAALPGVERIYRKMNVRVPAVTRYQGDFFGAPLHIGFEVLAVGVDPGLVDKDVLTGAFADPGPGQPIPALAAARLLELYNKTFAPARKLPQLSPQLLVGFTFPIEFNRSFVAQTVSDVQVPPGQVQIVGISDRALLGGLTIPLETARRINALAHVDADTFTGVTLQAGDPSVVPKLVDEVRQMGLKVDDQERRLAQNAGLAVALTTSALALLSVLICVLAAINIAHALSAQVRARAKELGVMRAVGASRRDIARIVLAEAAAVGIAGGIAGTAAALLGALAVDRVAGRFLPDFPFRPDSYFAFPAWLVALGVGLGLAAALAGAFLPSRHAAALDPARTLAG